jgi:hypothetical protein
MKPSDKKPYYDNDKLFYSMIIFIIVTQILIGVFNIYVALK